MVVPIGKVAGALFDTEAIPQLSFVVGLVNETVATQELASVPTETSAEHEIVGSSLSATVTSCVQVAVFPALSVTVQVTVVVPMGKVAGALLVTDATVQLSAVVGFVNETVATQDPASVSTETLAAHEMVGS